MRSSHKWEREKLSKIIFVFLGFAFAIGAHSISKEVAGFLLFSFLEENFVSLVIIDVLVILSDKILDHID